MGELINLNQARKKRERVEKEKAADENRARHGQTKAEKKGIASRLEQLRRALDGSKLDDDGNPPTSSKR